VLRGSGEKRGGFFVEVGAGDGVRFSNSYLLETRFGWRGIVAEPARGRRAALSANRRCAVDYGFVWSESGREFRFEEPTDLHYAGRTNLPETEEGATGVGSRVYTVCTISLNDLLAKYDAPSEIDYLSLDTEGGEADILEAFDFARYDVRTITVEHNFAPARERLFRLLTSRGYARVLAPLSRFDDWYVRNR
jgi:hypothetical protein